MNDNKLNKVTGGNESKYRNSLNPNKDICSRFIGNGNPEKICRNCTWFNDLSNNCQINKG